jgi:3-hydroxyisobutyrate dehydrogenase
MNGPVSVVGVGNMGGAIAANLLARGLSVQVCDLVPQKVRALEEKGAVALANAAQGAIKSVATVVCVVDDVQTEAVLFGPVGVANTAPAGHAVLLCPTLAPQAVEDFAHRLAARGIQAIDAPMSGGPARALDGSMSLMVACDDAVFAQHRWLLEALSGKLFRIGGRPGDGARTKLVNNLLAGINLVGAAEALALAARLGLDAAHTLDVIEQSSGQSWIGSDRLRRAIAGDYAPRAHVTLLGKDTRLAMDAARAAGFEGPLGAAARDTFARAVAAGLGDRDDAALYRLLSE